VAAENPVCPAIETEQDAIDLGAALTEVWHYDADWARKVFTRDVLFTHSYTGPIELNREIASRWAEYSTLDERRRIVTIYMERRLSR
jgi:hypothetical protein